MKASLIVSLALAAFAAAAAHPNVGKTTLLSKRLDGAELNQCWDDCLDDHEDDWEDYINCCDDCVNTATPGGSCTSSDDDGSSSDCISDCEDDYDSPDDGIGNDGADCATKCYSDCLKI